MGWLPERTTARQLQAWLRANFHVKPGIDSGAMPTGAETGLTAKPSTQRHEGLQDMALNKAATRRLGLILAEILCDV